MYAGEKRVASGVRTLDPVAAIIRSSKLVAPELTIRDYLASVLQA